MSRNRIANAMSQAAYNVLAASGAANGIGGRARTIPSKRDKSRDAKRQRREFRGNRWGE